MGVKRGELTILRFLWNKNNFLKKNMILKVKDALWSSHATFESRIPKTIVKKYQFDLPSLTHIPPLSNKFFRDSGLECCMSTPKSIQFYHQNHIFPKKIIFISWKSSFHPFLPIFHPSYIFLGVARY